MNVGKWGVVLAILGVLSMGSLSAASADTIRICAILAASGTNATQGQYVRDGIVLAVEEINKRGGVNGSKLEATFADSGSDAQTAGAAFYKMESSLHPILYISYSTVTGMALAPLAEANHVALMGLVTAAADFTKGREWVFRYWPLGSAYITPLLHILQDLKVSRLGIIYQNDDFGKEQQDLMRKAFSDAGGIAEAQPFDMKDIDYRRQIAPLMDRQSVYVACSGTNIQNVIRQLKAAGYKGSILTPSGGADPALFELPEMSGVYVAAPIIYNPAYLYAREAEAQFFARYKKPLNQWAANGYDFVKLVSGLLEEKVTTRQGVRDALAGGFEYSGVFGHVRLRAGEHDLTFPMYPSQILNGVLTYQ